MSRRRVTQKEMKGCLQYSMKVWLLFIPHHQYLKAISYLADIVNPDDLLFEHFPPENIA